jgi:hypothetical protein
MMAMNAMMKGLLAMGLALGVASGSLGCWKDGPMENAGEAVDDAVDDVTHPNEGPIEKAGRKLEESVDDATD